MTTPPPYRPFWSFIDTGAYYALVDRHDRNHASALSIQTRLTDEQWRLFTTNFVLAETHALLLTRLGRDTAYRLVSDIRASAATTLIRITPMDEERAWEIIGQYWDKRFSLTDATSFAAMERLGLSFAFTFDHNFTEYGRFIILQP